MNRARYRFLVAAFLMAISPLQGLAQIAAYQVQEESCDPEPGHDGSAKVVFPADTQAAYFNILWTYPDGNTSTSAVISGLESGNYTVKVTPKACPDKVALEEVVAITKKCDPKEITVAISVTTTSSDPCTGTLRATLLAHASGGVEPYHYSWPDQKLEVTVGENGGSFTCIVTDSMGNQGQGSCRLFAKKEECSKDPNEITGPSGYTDSLRWVSASNRMGYTIAFENDPDFATAPASRVSIVYPIPNNQNISSVRLSDFGFGSFVFTVPSNSTTYSQRLDVSDSLGIWVDVTAGIDIVNNQIFWIFQSIDPATGFEPSSSQKGFLSINDSLGHGEGYVSFFINPKSTVHTGDSVKADATIVFDDNAPISTNVWSNTFDAVAPQSHLTAQRSSSDSNYVNFSFTASDDANGSGIASVELWMSDNNENFSFYRSFGPDDTARFALIEGHSYGFASVAVDNVGNREAIATVADTSFNNNTAPTDILLAGNFFRENDAIGTIVGTLSTIDNDITMPFSYALVGGVGASDNDLFRIENNKLVTNAQFACNERFEYQVRISSTDISGLSTEKNFEITMVQQNEPKLTQLNAGICQGGTFSFGGRLLSSSGSYRDSLTTSLGCDSIVSLQLTVYPVFNNIDSITACDSYAWHDSTYTVSTTAPSLLLHSASGCDSTLSLHLTINQSSRGTTTADVCDSYSWNGRNYQSSTIDSITLANAVNCDSLDVLQLTLRQSSSTSLDVSACDSYAWFGTTYTASNTLSHNLTNAVGCDSTLTLHLTINHSNTITDIQTACDSYTWSNGQTYTASTDTPTQQLTNAMGCDSTVTLHLTLNHSNTTTDTQTACDSYTWSNGQTYTASTDTPTQQLTNAMGCDSTVTLNLTINHSSSFISSDTACDSYVWFGTTYTSSNTLTHTLTNAAGCDSTVTLHLTLNHSDSVTDIQTACDSYTWSNGQTYTASTDTPTQQLSNAMGCDSTVTLHLTLNHSDSVTDIQTACDSYTWSNGQTYTASTDTPTQQLTNAMGCDSTVTLNLTINHSSSFNSSDTACDSYAWFGTTYTSSNTLTHTLTNAAGCDSTLTLHLTINLSDSVTDFQTACDSYTWTNGQTYTASTDTPTRLLSNAMGCDSTVTLHLTLNHSDSVTDIQTACDSYTWSNGQTYTASTDTPTQQLTNAMGCDSTVTLHLTINHNTIDTISITSEGDYEWNGEVYALSGYYIWNGYTSEGCDSTIVLDLTINVGINSMDSLDYVKIHPNPTTGRIIINVANVLSIEVFDLQGRRVARFENTNEIDLSQMPAGSYTLRITLPQGTAIRKVIKR